jgi:hypothetical protein
LEQVLLKTSVTYTRQADGRTTRTLVVLLNDAHARQERDQKLEEELPWAVIGAVAVVVAGAVVVMVRRRGRVDSLSRLVVAALGEEWATRVGVDADDVRSAVLTEEAPEVRTRLAELVDDVEVDFAFNGTASVHATVHCTYAAGAAVTTTTATMDLLWDEVPPDVREDFLRSGDKSLDRHWAFQ